MYFKVDPNSKLHQELDALFQQGKDNRVVVTALVDEINRLTGDDCTQYYGVYEAQGGFSAKKFNDTSKVPEGWVRMKYDSKAFSPSRANKHKKRNRELLAKIDALPLVRHSDYSKVLGYKVYTGEENGNMIISTSPGIIFGNIFLISIYHFAIKAGYKPVDGMIEIKASEYHSIKEAQTEKAAKNG